jgi:hypothetical protein
MVSQAENVDPVSSPLLAIINEALAKAAAAKEREGSIGRHHQQLRDYYAPNYIQKAYAVEMIEMSLNKAHTIKLSVSYDHEYLVGMASSSDIEEEIIDLDEIQLLSCEELSITAKLIGSTFDIDSSFDDSYILHDGTELIWVWSVAPKELGEQDLVLFIDIECKGEQFQIVEPLQVQVKQPFLDLGDPISINGAISGAVGAIFVLVLPKVWRLLASSPAKQNLKATVQKPIYIPWVIR